MKLTVQGNMLTLLRADPATSEEEHFRLVLVQTEMERAKYVVRSYVRVRLHKVSTSAALPASLTTRWRSMPSTS